MSLTKTTRLASRLLIVAGLLTIGGCDQTRPPEQFSVVSGEVLSYRVETGELTIRGAQRKKPDAAGRTLTCLVTRNTEIYINDMLCPMDDIQLGDAIELIGREDPAAEPKSFLVSYAYVEHPTPPAPPPELTPASSPATRKSADNSKP